MTVEIDLGDYYGDDGEDGSLEGYAKSLLKQEIDKAIKRDSKWKEYISKLAGKAIEEIVKDG